jgi:hypothetical protein
VQGVHFDESEVPITSLQYGGCFCDTCMRGFRAYLTELPADERPTELEGTDLETFHYGAWLLERGHTFKSNRESAPLFYDYLRFQRRNIARHFGELADYAREYAASVGRELRISGNFFHLFDHYFALEPKVDVIVTEMRNTTYRQPSWYRYAAGFGGPKPVVVVENPYGGIVPELVEALEHGRGYDRFRRSLYEAAALGANMSVPYGAWMGSVIEDAFYPPHDLAVEIQSFLADHEDLFGRDPSFAEIAVVFSIESNYRALAAREVMADNRTNATPEGEHPFGIVCDALSDAMQPYDVVFFPDGQTREDDPERQDLSSYRTVILPSCAFLTGTQADLVERFLERGGNVLAIGELGTNLSAERRDRLIAHENLRTTAWFSLDTIPGGAQLRVTGGGPTDAATTLHAIERGAALHLIRYDEVDDASAPLDLLELEVRMRFSVSSCEIVDPLGQAKLEWETDGSLVRLRISDVPLYAIVVLER